MPRAVFLDRDDTLIATTEATKDTPYPGDLFDPALVRLLPGVREACESLKRAGFRLVVMSNQAGVARGVATVEQVESVNERLRDLLATPDGGSLIDAVYYCPYHSNAAVLRYRADHEWRKPRPGMILAAVHEHGIDLTESWVVGDSARDVEAGISAGIPPARCIRIGPGGAVADLAGAAAIILAGSRSAAPR